MLILYDKLSYTLLHIQQNSPNQRQRRSTPSQHHPQHHPSLLFRIIVLFLIMTSNSIPDSSTQSSTHSTVNKVNDEDYLNLNVMTNKVVKELTPIIKNLAARKAQLQLLNHDLDMFSSIRPKIGKVFNNHLLEETKLALLEDCRQNIKCLAVEEATMDIEALRQQKLLYFQNI